MGLLTEEQQVLKDLCFDLSHNGFVAYPVGGIKPFVDDYHSQLVPYRDRIHQMWDFERCTHVAWTVSEGFILIDVDHKNGTKQGIRQLAELEELLGPLPVTARQQTPSGGFHLILAVPADFNIETSQVPTVDGRDSHIDLCHSRLRYVRIYDGDFLLQPRAALPPAWLDWLTQRSALSPSEALRYTCQNPPQAGLTGDLVQAMWDAREGARNNTLNEVTLRLSLQGMWDEETAQLVIDGALHGGLPGSEVEATVRSALQGARRVRLEADRWLATLSADPRVQGRKARALKETAGHLHRHRLLHGKEFDLSCRELAENLGVRHNTASRYLKDLRRLGYLTTKAKGSGKLASTYTLGLPHVTNWNTHPLTTTSSKDIGVHGCVFQLVTRYDGHDLFLRINGSRAVPKSALWVLCAAECGATTVKEVAEVTGQSPATVRLGLRILQSRGIVKTSRAGKSLSIKLNYDDLQWELDQWASWQGTEGNGALLKLRHRHAREGYRKVVSRTGILLES